MGKLFPLINSFMYSYDTVKTLIFSRIERYKNSDTTRSWKQPQDFWQKDMNVNKQTAPSVIEYDFYVVRCPMSKQQCCLSVRGYFDKTMARLVSGGDQL